MMMDVYVVKYDIDYGDRKELDMRAIMIAEDISEAEKIVKNAYKFYSDTSNCSTIRVKSVENIFFTPNKMYVFGTCPYNISDFMEEY